MSGFKLVKAKANISQVANVQAAVRVCMALFMISGLLLVGQPALSQVPGGGISDEILEQTVEDSVAEQVEEQIQERIEDDTLSLGGPSNTIEQIIQGNIEDALEDSLEETVEDAIDETLTDNIEIVLEDNIESEVEEDLEEAIEGIVEESVEGIVEESVLGAVEEQIEEQVAESVAQSVEESLEIAVEEEVAAVVEQDIESTVEDTIEDRVETGLESAAEEQIASAIEERVDEGIDDILDRIEMDERRIRKDQWLVMAAPEVFLELAEEGYLFATVTELPGLGLRLAEVAAPSSFDITEVRQGVIDIVGSDRAEVDLNHIYAAGDQLPEQTDGGIDPGSAMDFPGDTGEMLLRIGMIDSQVDVAHPALRDASIQTRSFTSDGAVLPSFHGTAIASIIVGNGAGYRGIAPKSEIFAAEVFEQDARRGEIASTVSLVMALDWLISSEVDVINISLAGPPNRLLEAALQRASDSKVTILAAAGNGGPTAAPMYPAAYTSVAAVTAVGPGGQVFRLANRGEYLDIAAPGVGVRHAKSGGGFAASSGTSFAVPFASAAVARLRQLQPGDNALELLCRSAEDLGPPGRDSIYGFGLLRPASS